VNLAEYGLGVAAAAAVATSVAVLTVPAGYRFAVAGAGTALAGAAGLAAGAAAAGGQSFALAAPGLLPLWGASFAVDPLGGIFLAVTGGVAVAAGIYAAGYARHSGTGRAALAVLPLFAASMLGVPAAASAGTLLACWELMALASLLLVLTEHRRPEVAEAGRWYAVMTHLGFVCILAGLMILAAHAGGDSFAALRAASGQLSPAVRDLVFVLVLAGFGSKAGMVPLHAWLPRAHPEAPSHVSALMSAAMVNLGIYGLIRVGLGLLGGGTRWWWLLVLALGAVTAVYGILQAAMSTDLKRLLGYSTTENMGVVLVGIGAAGLFAVSGHRVLAGLALGAALLHVVNHAAFKTLLFLSAGSVVHGTGTRDLDALGGLRTAMPVTTAAFGWGALAASALPPGTAFVSEWLLLQALVHGLPGAGTAGAVVLPVAVAAVALTAGLAVATFVKAFGTGFLARPRSGGAAGAAESPASMLTGMGLAGAACAVLALAPGLVLPAIARAAGAVAGPGGQVAAGLVTVRLAGVTGAVSPLLTAIALVAVMIAAAAALRAVPARRARRAARLWDCGAGPLTARMEYTATSFAEPLQRVFDDVVAPETGIDVTHLDEARYLIAAVEYRRRVPDRIEYRLYRPVLSAVGAWGAAGRRLAPGSVHRYLGYGFCALTVLLIVLAVTR
jgi:formate hydrogenlyase subunit 3/multisubunit Na+/H+ antiporter MnhD subunit